MGFAPVMPSELVVSSARKGNAFGPLRRLGPVSVLSTIEQTHGLDRRPFAFRGGWL